MLLNQSLGHVDLLFGQTLILRQGHGWLKPELGLAVGTLNMYMTSRLFTGEKVKPEATVAKNGRAHRKRLLRRTVIRTLADNAQPVGTAQSMRQNATGSDHEYTALLAETTLLAMTRSHRRPARVHRAFQTTGDRQHQPAASGLERCAAAEYHHSRDG